MFAIGIWSEMPVDGLFVLAYGFIISRALYGFSILAFKHAKESKCSVYMPEGILRYVQIFIMIIYVGFSAVSMLQVNREIGAACILGALISFVYYIGMSYKEFGGVTEDSAGFFIQICEVAIPLAALIAYKRWW